ncbi:MAG: cyclic nucleotide-binding domain-containing protein [Proteobacteria bacterium]|nr:cyclic nucleotide-binding domain-containing protein [Pseudomonadota bacterium]
MTDELLQYLPTSMLPAGTALATEGEPHGVLTGLLFGMISIRAGESELARLDQPGWLGEIGFADAGPATATLLCVTDCHVVQIDRDGFNELVATHPHMADTLISQVASTLSERLVEATKGTVESLGAGRFTLRSAHAKRPMLRRALARLMGAQ